MVFVKGSYFSDVGKKFENPENVIAFVFANADNIYKSNKHNKKESKQTLPKPNFVIYCYASNVPIIKLNWKNSLKVKAVK